MLPEPNDDDPLAHRFGHLVEQYVQARNVGADLLALAEEAASQSKHAVLACRAYANAAQAFINYKLFLRAKVAVSRGKALSRQRSLRAFQAAFLVLEAQVSEVMGDHAGAARTLLSVLKSRLSEHLSPRHRILLFRDLADICAVTDPGDSLDLCISLGEAAWPSTAGHAPVHWLAQVGASRIHQYIWSDPRFVGRLRPLKLDPKQRSQSLSKAREALERAKAACSNDRAERLNARTIESLYALLSGLTSQSVRDVWKSLLDDGDSERHARVTIMRRNAAAYVFHILERPDLSQQVLERNTPDELDQADWHDNLEQIYLKSLTAEALGGAAEALDLYRTYCVEMSQRMEHMDLGLHDALKTLTELPGGRPQDLRDSVPGYLRRALELLHQDPVNIDVSALALAAGVSEGTLRSAFYLHCGAAPKVYTTQLRLDAAKRHLDACIGTPPTVSELAEQFGFSHPGRFAAAYARHHGKRPWGRNG